MTPSAFIDLVVVAAVAVWWAKGGWMDKNYSSACLTLLRKFLYCTNYVRCEGNFE